MAAPVCVLSGVVTDSSGAVKPRELVRARILDRERGYVRDGVAIAIGTVTTLSDTSGAWSLTFPQGARVRVEIPASGVDHVGTLPDAATSAFDELFTTMRRYAAP